MSTLLERWRKLKHPLIHIHYYASNPLDPLHPSHSETCAAHPCATPLSHEPVRYKSTGSAFIGTHKGTSLLEALEDLRGPAGEPAHLVIVGMDGAQCVNSTTRNAADLGFHVTVVADACASFGTRDWKSGAARGAGWSASAEETHEMAMAMAGGRVRACGVDRAVDAGLNLNRVSFYQR